ncbi:MAG: nucleotide exchange factor GrpE [Bdellovibrionaceae bacterium]|nr:nucleotide exchange factor GrpE [Pseudobdellovibrionaceae bacterium]|tara:strand:+ start:32880 stop:33467 length:588 start_codon:yes stop_codon:yes gene_type:complete
MSEITEENEKQALESEVVEEQAEEQNQNEELDAGSSEVSEIESLREELTKAKNDYLYLRADFDNYRKKMIEERSSWKKYGSEGVLRQIIAVLDNFDLALMTEVNPENLQSFHEGVKMIRAEMGSSLETAGVKEIEVMGKAFDPQIHEALGAEESSEVEDGHVLRVFKRGYKLHDRILRPAQVIIAKTPSSEDNEA